MIAEYLNADRETAIALKDEWGIADILRAVDRRIGRRQWDGLLENINPKVSNAVGKIISSRKISRKSQIEPESRRIHTTPNLPEPEFLNLP